MDERIIQFRVGVMVLATLLITAILVILFGEIPAFMEETYAITVKFSQAPGVTRDTPVRKSGILIGRVGDVRFDEDGGVLVTANIRTGVPLRRNEIARIGSTLFGEADLQFVPSPDPRATKGVVKPGEVLPGEAPINPFELMASAQQDFARMERSFSDAMVVAAETGDEMKRVVVKIGDLVDSNEQKVSEVLSEAETTLESVRRVMENLNSVTGDPAVQENLRQSIAQVPRLLEETRQTVRGIDEMMGLVRVNLTNIEQATRPFGERTGPFMDRLEGSSQKLDVLLDQLLVFSRSLNSQESTLGRLTHDDQLYRNINEAAANLRDLSVQARPIVQDVRVFTDKIARHPESLGVRGAIQRNAPGLK